MTSAVPSGGHGDRLQLHLAGKMKSVAPSGGHDEECSSIWRSI